MTSKAQVAAIMDPTRRRHFVYCAYDNHGMLLYIGCTMQPELRMQGHKSARAEWLKYVVRYRAYGPYNYQTARRLERDAIREHQPPFNADTVDYMAAKRAHDRLFDRLTERHLATGMNPTEASRHALAEIDRLSPKAQLLYAPVAVAR